MNRVYIVLYYHSRLLAIWTEEVGIEERQVEKDVIEFVTVPFDTNEPYDVPCGSDFCTECKVEVTARWVDDEARWRCGNCFYPFAKEPEFGELCPGCFYAIAKKIRELD